MFIQMCLINNRTVSNFACTMVTFVKNNDHVSCVMRRTSRLGFFSRDLVNGSEQLRGPDTIGYRDRERRSRTVNAGLIAALSVRFPIIAFPLQCACFVLRRISGIVFCRSKYERKTFNRLRFDCLGAARSTLWCLRLYNAFRCNNIIFNKPITSSLKHDRIGWRLLVGCPQLVSIQCGRPKYTVSWEC
jgi:hypothetical protein